MIERPVVAGPYIFVMLKQILVIYHGFNIITNCQQFWRIMVLSNLVALTFNGFIL